MVFYYYRNTMSRPRINKKIPKEIAKGLKSTDFKFYVDENKILSDTDGPNDVCYLLFKPEDGPYKNQTHVLRFQWTARMWA